jgi:non-canonical purine NTP pyrophosphatase (RdgB/HAM1 family)
MQRIPVTSSDLVSVGYDELARVLEIEFKEDRIYQYFDVPKDIYKGLVKADSPGTYFFAHINAYFRYRKVSGASTKFTFMSRNTVTFVTSNARKLREMQNVCVPLGITVKHQEIDVDEIQAHDPHKIALAKAEEAFKRAGGVPIVINDAFWSIPALNGFPGGYMKDIWQWFAPEDFLHLMESKADRTVIATETVIYKDKTQTRTFSCDMKGIIAAAPRGKGNSIEQVVETASGKTLAELHEAGRGMPANVDEDVWTAFAQWFLHRP